LGDLEKQAVRGLGGWLAHANQQRSALWRRGYSGGARISRREWAEFWQQRHGESGAALGELGEWITTKR